MHEWFWPQRGFKKRKSQNISSIPWNGHACFVTASHKRKRLVIHSPYPRKPLNCFHNFHIFQRIFMNLTKNVQETSVTITKASLNFFVHIIKLFSKPFKHIMLCKKLKIENWIKMQVPSEMISIIPSQEAVLWLHRIISNFFPGVHLDIQLI